MQLDKRTKELITIVRTFAECATTLNAFDKLHEGCTYGNLRQWAVGRSAALGGYNQKYHLTTPESDLVIRALEKHLGLLRKKEDATASKYAEYPDLPLDENLEVIIPGAPVKQKTKRIMDKNLPALLRNDAKTIGVVFPGNSQVYTYVTHLPVQVNDHVVVPINNANPKIASVCRVDDEVKIEPGDDIVYTWVIGVIDMKAAEENNKRNETIQAEAAVVVRENMRRSFASQVLGAATEDQRNRLLALTGKP